MNSGKNYERRYDIDWLRIFALVTVFFFHCARIFDYDDWHIKNNQRSFGITLFVTFVAQWIMPLFFVLSGESAFFSLKFRNVRQYVLNRLQRLIVPFIFGMFVLTPPQIYLERVSRGEFVGSFIQFYPHYFDGLYGYGGNFAWMGLHLWYLLFLFIFSMLTLPFFFYHLKKGSKYNLTLKITTFLEKPGTIFLLAIPLALILIFTDCLLFKPNGPFSEWSGFVYFGGWNLLIYLIFFIYGYMLASHEQFKEIIRKHGKIAMVLSVIFSTIMFLQLTVWNAFLNYPLRFIILPILDALHSWCWVITILGLGSVYFSFKSKWVKDANEVALPFYILHQPVIVAIGFFVVNVKLSIFVKYLVISTSALICTVFLLLIIRRFDLLRFFFGMRLKRQIRA